MWKEAEFLEAVEAYHNGQTIECRLDNHTFTYIPDEDTESPDLGFEFSDCNAFCSVTTIEILEGKWFIKSNSKEEIFNE